MTEKIALVTGGTRGIGQTISTRLAADGYHVLVNYRAESDYPGETLAAIQDGGGSAEAVVADIGDVDAISRMFADITGRFGRCDVLVNNAGVSTFESLWDITEAVWDRIHSVNLKGAFFCSQHAARLMVDAGNGGRIVSISSISAHVGGVSEIAYCPTKSGVRSLMQSLCLVLGPQGITCNSVSPGTISTPLVSTQMELAGPELLERYIARIPVGRLGLPEEVAAAVSFLASPQASYVNGAEILVDGGVLANPE